MTEEERVASLHGRMKCRKYRKERRKIRALGMTCTGLALCLVMLVFGGSTAHQGGTAGLFSGATMLYENAGAYVFTALVAFMAGVVITILCLRYRKAERRRKPPETESDLQLSEEEMEK